MPGTILGAGDTKQNKIQLMPLSARRHVNEKLQCDVVSSKIELCG